jgi:hypothetical protein
MSGGGWLAVVVPAAMALGLVQLVRRKLAEAPDRDWIAGQPVVFEARASIWIPASAAGLRSGDTSVPRPDLFWSSVRAGWKRHSARPVS